MRDASFSSGPREPAYPSLLGVLQRLDDWEKARASAEIHLASPSSGHGSFRTASPGRSNRPPTPNGQRQWQVAHGVRSLQDLDYLKKRATLQASDGPYEERHKDNWFVTQALRSSPTDGLARSGPGGSSRSPCRSPGSPCRSPGHSGQFSSSRLEKGKALSNASTAAVSLSTTGTPKSCLGSSSRCSDALHSTRAKLGFTSSFCLTPRASQSYDPLHLPPSSAAATAPAMSPAESSTSLTNSCRGGAVASRCRSRDLPSRPSPLPSQQRARSRDTHPALSAIARRSRSVERPLTAAAVERQGPIFKERTPRNTPGWDGSNHTPRSSSYDPPAHAYSSRYSADSIFSEQLRGWQALPLPPAMTAGQPGSMTVGSGRLTSPHKKWVPRWPHQYGAASPSRAPESPWRGSLAVPTPSPQRPASASKSNDVLIARVAELTQELATVCGAVAAGNGAASNKDDGGWTSSEWDSVARQLAQFGREFPVVAHR